MLENPLLPGSGTLVQSCGSEMIFFGSGSDFSEIVESTSTKLLLSKEANAKFLNKTAS